MSTTDHTLSGFQATLEACKKLGLDLSGVPPAVLQIFYNSGQAFADHGIITHEQRVESHKQRQRWRDSVIWPRVPEPEVKRGPGRPPKPK